MILPLDINKLICTYVINPIYTIDKLMIEQDWFINPNNVNQLTPDIISHLLNNPLISQTDLFNYLAKSISQRELITKLLCAHSPCAIKYIIKPEGWLEDILALLESGISIWYVLDNPYATPIIDGLYRKRPNIFDREDAYNLSKSKSAENIITNQEFLQIYPIRLHDLLTNPSDIVFEKFQLYEKHIAQSEFVLDNLGYLLKNTNEKLLSKAIGHLPKYLNNQFAYNALSYNEKKLLNEYICDIVTNHAPLASKILRQIFDNMVDINIVDRVDSVFLCDSFLTNPSDYIVDLVIGHINTLGMSERVVNRLLIMTNNKNPKAIKFIKEKIRTHPRFNNIILTTNPGAIDFIREEPNLFSSNLDIYENPAIFVPKTNKRLVNCLSGIIKF